MTHPHQSQQTTISNNWTKINGNLAQAPLNEPHQPPNSIQFHHNANLSLPIPHPKMTSLSMSILSNSTIKTIKKHISKSYNGEMPATLSSITNISKDLAHLSSANLSRKIICISSISL